MSQEVFEVNKEEEKDQNSENIRILYDKLVSSIDKEMPPLEYTNHLIKFQLYKSHFEVMLLNVDNIFENLCLLLFQDLFEDSNERFKIFTLEKQEYILKLVDEINNIGKNNLHLMNINILKKNDELKCINEALTWMEIEPKFIFLMNVHLIEKGLTLSNFITFLQPIFVAKFPDLEIDLSEANNETISVNNFTEKLLEIYFKEENFFTNSFYLKWDNEKKDFIFKREANDEICQKLVMIDINKEVKRKKKKKKNKKNNEKTINVETSVINPSSEIETPKKEEIQGSSSTLENKTQEKKIEEIEIQKKETTLNCEQLSQMVYKMKNDLDAQNKTIDGLNKTIDGLNKTIDGLNKTKDDQNKKIDDQNKKIEDLEKENKNLKKDITNLNKKRKKANYLFSQSKAKIENLEFILKMISLRNLYKSFFDVIIYLFDINTKYKTKDNDKYEIIVKFLKTDKTQETRELKLMLKDIKDLLDSGNKEAHMINLNGNILQNLFDLIKKYKNENYPKIEEFIQKTNFEYNLKELVSIRNQRYCMDREKFKEKENQVINNIKSDKELKKEFLNKIY